MSSDHSCRLCGNACADADLGPLLTPELAWFWHALAAAADRRGDPHLTDGRGITVLAPQDPAQRAAAVSLIGGSTQAGQRRSVSLPTLAELVRRRGPSLTPGAVAAHAVRRPLAQRALDNTRRTGALQELADALRDRLRTAALPQSADIVDTLRRTGALARLLAIPDATQVIADAVEVIAALPAPGHPVDRRLLADRTLADPHGLDEGTRVEVLARAILTAAGLVPPGTRARAAWAQVGVEWDEASGGIGTIGIHPDGWSLPPTAVTTIPPIELVHCTWTRPASTGSWIFVTENPSVLTAARRLAHTGVAVRLLCTSGTPSETEVAAIARLTQLGWNLAVRADFDEAGLRHVRSLLAATDRAVPWRMTPHDYLDSLDAVRRTPLPTDALLDSPWDPHLAYAMRKQGAAAFEESLIPRLMDDLARGVPG